MEKIVSDMDLSSLDKNKILLGKVNANETFGQKFTGNGQKLTIHGQKFSRHEQTPTRHGQKFTRHEQTPTRHGQKNFRRKLYTREQF